jgi:Fe-S cluster biogenesis protein NfuA
MYAAPHRKTTLSLEGLSESDREILERLIQALDKLRPLFHSEGGDAQIASLRDGVARIEFGGRRAEVGTTAGMEGGLRLMLLERVPGLKEVIFE